MRTFFLGLLLAGLFLNLSSSFRGQDLFQVITSHPHDLEEIAPYIRTTYQNGRLWVVQLKENAPLEVRKHLRPLQGGERAFLPEVLFKDQKKFRMKDHVLAIVENFDKEAMKKDILHLASFETRMTGTEENKALIQEGLERFKQMGYEARKICYAYDACSVIAEKKGSELPDEVIMVMAHIDSVGESHAGADDNASGVAVVYEMARTLSTFANKKTIRFFITNGEEKGLLGASHYARLLTNQNKIGDLALVINMDMIGHNQNGIVELETNPEYEELARWYALLAARYTNLKAKISLGAWGSDHVPFLKRGVPSLLTIENWDTKNPCYHKECDLPDLINYDYAAEIGKLNLAAVIIKDQI